MKIRLLSDLHLEGQQLHELYPSKGEDVLVIAGDLHVGSSNCFYVLQQFAKEAKQVIFVPGNHEYYGQEFNEVNESLRNLTKGSNISFLNPGTAKVGDVTFIGATLWTNFGGNGMSKRFVPKMITDFRVISRGGKRFTGDMCSALYDEHIAYIKEAYSKIEGPKVIVTHFLPAKECIAPIYQNGDIINDYFANDLGEYISDLKDATWLFGHTHEVVSLKLGDTRLIANPYGYKKRANYQECIIEV